MGEGDGETWYAYYCLNKFHWLPSQFVNLPLKEKAVVMAFIDERIAQEKRQSAQARKAGRKGGRR